MALTTTISANDILNRVAAEVGITPVVDPYSSTDTSFVKMRYLLNTAGEELLQAHTWEFLLKEHQITTQDGDTADYPLPDDFAYMLNQTGWERSNRMPLGGPLSPQEWAILKGVDLAQSSIYVSFRLQEGVFRLYPDPPPVGLDINFEYVSTDWCRTATEPYEYKQAVDQGTDIVLYDKTLITRYLKVKYLESGGFDTTKAQDDFVQCFSFLTSKDKGAQVLNAGRGGYGFPYLTIGNLPISGYGH